MRYIVPFVCFVVQSFTIVYVHTKPFHENKSNGNDTAVITTEDAKQQGNKTNLTTTPAATTTPATTTPYYQLIIIIQTTTSKPLSKCCNKGIEAGKRGYYCLAHPDFVNTRYYLSHPFKMKFDPVTRKHVQLELAQEIQKCAGHPATKRKYERCCERALQQTIDEDSRIKRLVQECRARGEKNCNRYHHKDGT